MAFQKQNKTTLNGVFPEDHGSSDFLFKIVLVGDSGVGKTNILSRFVRDIFCEDSKTTIGVEFATKTMTIKNKTVRLQIWDTAGQERYRAITNSYYRGANAAMVVFDITNSNSFKNVPKWLTEIRNNTDSASSIPIMLIANKSDLSNSRSVREADYKQIVESEHTLECVECSAKVEPPEGKVKEAFETLAKKLVESQENSSFSINLPKVTPPIRGKNIGNDSEKKNPGCCKNTK
ncbi:hypothetical protein M9Y10_036188 [Tritrichomonas musculus]|uniref:Uncharacterized protein n=1 Tax=Tritrichomonas musculus TaxID=1915356 RepID=A0ABR2GUQ2_9EUKA